MVTRPGPGVVVVEAVVVAVSTVAVPSTQVIVVPNCEQVVDCACACAGRRKIAAAVETLLSSAKRTFKLAMSKSPFLPCAQKLIFSLNSK